MDGHVYSYQLPTEQLSSGTPTGNLHKYVNQEVNIPLSEAYDGQNYLQMTKHYVRSSYVKEMGNLETFGRPSAMSQEKICESSLIIDNSGSPLKNSERLDTQTNDQTSIRKQGKKKK